MTAGRPGFDDGPYLPLVLSDGLLDLAEQLAAGVPRQQALGSSYNRMAMQMMTLLGRTVVPLPEGARHGSGCLAEACDHLRPIFEKLASLTPRSPEAAAYQHLMGRLSWQVEAVRRVVEHGMPIGHAARHAQDLVEGKAPGSKGRRGPLDPAWVLAEVAKSRADIDSTLTVARARGFRVEEGTSFMSRMVLHGADGLPSDS